MKESDDLFDLIHSMDSHEKGYFKKYAQLHGSAAGNHLRLFDAINKQSEYNETQIIKKFKDEKMSGNLATAKYYLSDLIMRSLRAYRENNSALIKLNAYIENTETLFQKGLYSQGEKMLSKCLDLAEQMDDPIKTLEVHTWKRKFISGMSAHNMEKETNDSVVDSLKTIEKIKNYTVLRQLYYKAMGVIRRDMSMLSTTKENDFDGIIDHPLVVNPELVEGFNQKLTLYNIQYIYNYLNCNFEASYNNMLNIIELWENHPMIREQNMDTYIGGLNNYITACISYNKLEELKKQLDNVDRISVQGSGLKAKLFENVALWKLYYGIVSGNSEYLMSLTPEIEQGLIEHEGRMHESRPLIINNAMAMIYMVNCQYDKALHKINALLDMKKIDMRKDIQMGVRIVNIMVHFELGNEEMLEHTIRSTRRYLESREYLNDFSKLVLGYFNKIIGKDIQQRLKLIEDFKNELEQYIQESQDKRKYVDFLVLGLLAWAESKLINKPINVCFDVVAKNQSELFANSK